MATSLADRAGLHSSFERSISRSEERHAELLATIRDAGKEARAGLELLTREIAVERKRIDAWENKAAGASFFARYLPHGLWATASALAAWVVANWKAVP